jgi:hypothetical protein
MGATSEICKWSMNDMSIYWLKFQNLKAVDIYIANPPTKQVGKTTQVAPIKYPF